MEPFMSGPDGSGNFMPVEATFISGRGSALKRIINHYYNGIYSYRLKTVHSNSNLLGGKGKFLKKYDNLLRFLMNGNILIGYKLKLINDINS
jgi:hypothetical protein